MTEILEELRGKSAGDLTEGRTPDELRGKTPQELKDFVEVLDAHLRSLHQTKASSGRRRTTSRPRSTTA